MRSEATTRIRSWAPSSGTYRSRTLPEYLCRQPGSGRTSLTPVVFHSCGAEWATAGLSGRERHVRQLTEEARRPSGVPGREGHLVPLPEPPVAPQFLLRALGSA